MKPIKSALISVFYKDGLLPLVQQLDKLGVTIYSTGGTQKFIEDNGIGVTPVEKLTDYPSILGGRVKTLHPKVFGGILSRRDNEGDREQLEQYAIPEMDMVVVDLYPFEETVANTEDEQEIIEKIDIGGISLIRAAAKNYKDVLTVASRNDYDAVVELLKDKEGKTELSDRKHFAAKAFNISSHYDTHIFNYFNGDGAIPAYKASQLNGKELRYGENPHQKGVFYGDLDALFEQLNGKALSYNNLVDIDAALGTVAEFDDTAFVVIKHTNACGVAVRPNLLDAWKAALAGDPVSAFGGVLATNRTVDKATAEAINEIFFEVLVAPGYEEAALEVLKSKKNRIILKQKAPLKATQQVKSVLDGILVQDYDKQTEGPGDLNPVTTTLATPEQINDLVFAAKVCKHLKSNTIVLAKQNQLLGMGCGQTSRVDALKQAIIKAEAFGFDLHGAVMASDAFFPFADSVEIANKAGIKAVIQPGGSVRDKDSIDYCNEHDMAMVFTGFRHFRH